MRYDEFMDSDFTFDHRERAGYLVLSTSILAASMSGDQAIAKANLIVDKVEEQMRNRVKAEYEKRQKSQEKQP